MRRYGIAILVSGVMLFMTVMDAAALTIKNSKHDLSTGSTGATIKAAAAGGTSQICVFCHTPHSAKADAPLWNRNLSTAAYTSYASDVLAALSLAPEDLVTGAGSAAHIKSRLCLSCHDGTIALGQLVNLPAGFTADIPMEGGVTTIPTTAAGYIGLDLRDDHPVAILHNNAADPELRSLITGSDVWLYTTTAARTQSGLGVGYVECTSCHDPHDDQYTNFLVASNFQSGICTSCHTKTGFDPDSIHATSTTAYQPPDGGGPLPDIGTTVGTVKCMSCHFPHKSGVTIAAPTTPNPDRGKYLLTFQEEQSCFNTTNRWGQAVTVCHGTGGTSGAKNIDIQTEMGKFYAHKVGDYTGFHAATEGTTGYSWLANWHVECADCHNPHTAGTLLHTLGTNTISAVSPFSVLYGAGGVTMSWPAAWTVPTAANYTYEEPKGVVSPASPGVTKEYEICLKCHSSFSWGINPPPSPPAVLTDQALEFNPSNASYHPVAGSNTNTEGTYVSPWTSGTQTMYCSDCHGNNAAAPVGPHGSSNRSILTSAYDPVAVGTVSSELCFDCHDYATYYSGGVAITNTGFRDATRNLHFEHMHSAGFPYQGGVPKRCTGCHLNPPHGSDKAHLIAYSSDPVPYGSYSSLTSYTDAGSGNYIGGSCSATACHSAAHP